MKPTSELRARFSPYQLAAAGHLVLLLGFPGLIGMFLIDAGPFALIILVLLVGAASLLLKELSRCPSCRKPPIRYYLLGSDTGISRFLFGNRIWPERICSYCRNRLDDL